MHPQDPQDPQDPQRPHRGAKPAIRAGALLLALSLATGTPNSWAQVVPSSAAPAGKKALLDVSAAGVPIINIAPPGSAGVSHNLFTRFDWGPAGAIFNNSASASTTYVAGSIKGNPQLGATPARLIVNEISGTTATQLHTGWIEVAGPRADLVFANPLGVSCNGCGFINTGRTVLVSGRPEWLNGISGGTLSAYAVSGGKVEIGSSGLQAKGMGDLSLVGGQVTINGPVGDAVSAIGSIFVVAGANRVDHNSLLTSPLARSSGLPLYAVDVATAGSINTRQIYIVSTEPAAGLLINGTLTARAGGITLDVAGNLVHQGTLRTSEGGAIVATAAGIEQRTTNGLATGGGGVSQAPGGLVLLQARKDATLKYAALTGGDVLITAGAALNADNTKLAATGDVRLAAGTGEMDVLAGTIDAGGNLALASGNHLTLRAAESSSTTTVGTSTVTTTTFDKPLLSATGDVSLQSTNGAIVLDGARVSAGRSLALQAPAVQVLARKNLRSEVTVSGNRTTKPTSEELVPTALNAGGDLSILATGLAGRDDLGDIFITGAQINAGTGQLSMLAARDIDIAHDTTTDTTYSEYHRVKRRLFGKTITREIKSTVEETLTPSQLLGATISLGAGRDLSVVASELQADGSVGLHADGDLSLLSAGAHSYAYSNRTVRKSGVFSSGSLGITIGSRTVQQIASQQALEQTATQVSSLFGDIAASAGNQYLQMSSALIAPLGSIAVSGKDVAFQTSHNTRTDFSLLRMKQWGVTLQAGHPWLTTAQTFTDALKRAQATDSGHHQALAGLTAALSVYNAYTDVATTPAGKAPSPTNGWTLSAAVGSSSNSYQKLTASTTPLESTLDAGRDLSITAWGTGADSGDITALGAALTAAGNTTLNASRDIHLLAATGTSSEATRSKSSSGAIGLSFNLGGPTPSTPVAVTLAASRSRAWSNGWGTTYYDTHVTAGQTLNLATGRDLTLKGAKASSTSVVARVGTAAAGNLTIASPQDEAHYTSKDTSAGFSVSVPIGPGALSGTLSYANARLLADWQSVREQTAIVAGTGGYDINVNGHTHLKGGALSSETSANRLVTQSFTHEAVTNRDYVSGSASTVGLSIGVDPNKPGLGGSSLGWASVNRSSVAHTTAAVAAGTLTVTRPDLNATRFASIRAQDKAPLLARRTALQAQLDELLAEGLLRASPAKDGVLGTASYTASSTAPPKAPTPDQPIEPYPGWWTAVTALRTQIAKVDSQIRANDARVLQDQATVSRNPSTSHQPLLHTFDAAKASAQLKTDAAITAAFGREAFKTVGTQADKLRDAAEATCKGNAASPACAEVDKWAEGGRYRTALHAAVGGVSFGVAGAAGVVASAAAQQVLSESLTKTLAAAGITDATAVNAIRGVMSLAAGAAAGGAAGTAAGFNVDANNRQLHGIEVALIAKRARDFARATLGREPTDVEVKAFEDRLSAQAQRDISLVTNDYRLDSEARAFLRNVVARDAVIANGGRDPLFFAPGNNTMETLFTGSMQGLTDDTIFSAQGDRVARGRLNARIAEVFANPLTPGAYNPAAYWSSVLDFTRMSEAANRAAVENALCLTGAGCLVVNGVMFRDAVETIKRGDAKLGWAMLGLSVVGGGASAVLVNQELKGLSTAAVRTFGQAAARDTILGSAAEKIYASSRPLDDVLPELKGVNPHYVQDAGVGVNTNCVSCVNAADARLRGADPNAVATQSGVRGRNDLLPSIPLGFGPDILSAAQVEVHLLAAGNGSRGVVLVKQPGGVDHVINVVNRNGTVLFVDTQIGRVVKIRPEVKLLLGRP